MFLFHKKETVRKKTNGPFIKFYLLLFKTVTASTAFRVATTRVAHVNLAKGAVIARTVVLAIGYATTDARVYVLSIHHDKNLLLEYKEYAQTIERLLTFLKNCCKIVW